MDYRLNERALKIAQAAVAEADELRIQVTQSPEGARLLDFGIEAEGGLLAGQRLAEICTSGLAQISIVPGRMDDISWPHVQVISDHPVAACLYSQYAGWQLAVGKFFAMGSGPMRAVAAREELFEKLGYKETASGVVGILEGRKLPDAETIASIAEKTGVAPSAITLCVARTKSMAGNFQVVTRVVETALHKLFEVGFDMETVRSAYGSAPLPPVATDDLEGIGRTNDAILYGGRVVLCVRGSDEPLAEIGPRIPAVSSSSYGLTFLEIFKRAGGDFYKIDPRLFSPAEIVFHNLDTGIVHRFGKTAPLIVKQSFGLN